MPYCKAKRGGRPLSAAAGSARTRFFFTSVGDKKLTILIRHYLHKKIKKSDKPLPFSSIAATQLQTLAIKGSKLIFILLAFAFAASTAYADVYKCVVNGKTVYSDARCAYIPGIVRISPDQNVVQGERGVANVGRNRYCAVMKTFGAMRFSYCHPTLSLTRVELRGSYHKANVIAARSRFNQEDDPKAYCEAIGIN
jgi:hypothetical protein